MANYTNEYSNFPESLIERKTFKDIDETVLPYVTEYFNAMMSNNYGHAQYILASHDLDAYIINAYIFNWLIEEIRNTQIYALSDKQFITYVESVSELPTHPIDGHIYRVKR